MKNKFTAALCALLTACSCGLPLLPVHAAEPASAVSSVQDYSDAVVSLVNQERASQGLSPLKSVDVLDAAAEIRSQEIITLFSHTRPDGRSCSTVLEDTGVSWRTTGENIAYGYSSPEAVMNGWMNSSGHRANILNPNFDAIGVGAVTYNGVIYWTQIFTGGADYSDAYVPEFTPSVPDSTVTIPETETTITDLLPSDICIGDSCFNFSGTDCFTSQDLLSCLTGNCNTQDVLSALNQNGNCNVQDVLSALNQNGNCNAQDVLSALNQNSNCNAQDVLSALNQNSNCNAQDVLSALNQNGNCNAQDVLSALNQNSNCNAQDVLSALNQNCGNGNILSILSGSCK